MRNSNAVELRDLTATPRPRWASAGVLCVSSLQRETLCLAHTPHLLNSSLLSKDSKRKVTFLNYFSIAGYLRKHIRTHRMDYFSYFYLFYCTSQASV